MVVANRNCTILYPIQEVIPTLDTQKCSRFIMLKQWEVRTISYRLTVLKTIIELIYFKICLYLNIGYMRLAASATFVWPNERRPTNLQSYIRIMDSFMVKMTLYCVMMQI